MFRKLFNLIFGTEFDGVIDLTPVELPKVERQKNITKPYTISQKGIDLIKLWESLELESYPDTGGVWTIGYGTTEGIKPGIKITKDQAEKLLSDYIANQNIELNKALEEVTLLSQDQFDAISSFVYNIGMKQFLESTFLSFLKESNWQKAANQLVRRDSKGIYHGWIYDNGKKIQGLITRRKAEKELFLQGSLI